MVSRTVVVLTTLLLSCLASLGALLTLKLADQAGGLAQISRLSFTSNFPEGVRQLTPHDANIRNAEKEPNNDKDRLEESAQLPGDLPLLPANRSPESDTWDNSVAICACMKQENVTDVREWLLYHQWLGVDHVYLAENVDRGKKLSPVFPEELQGFIDEGFLSLYAFPRPAGQKEIYRACMDDNYATYNWLTFIDLDEYIHVRGDNETLKGFLDERKYEAAIAMHWILFGSNHKQTRPPEGGMMRHYTRCLDYPWSLVKVIANTYHLIDSEGAPHNFVYRGNRQAVDENGISVPFRGEAPEHCDPSDNVTPGCRMYPGKKLDDPGTAEHIAVFHYVTKSKEDFRIKTARAKRAKWHGRGWDYFRMIQKRAWHKGGICAELAPVADACCPPLTAGQQ